MYSFFHSFKSLKENRKHGRFTLYKKISNAFWKIDSCDAEYRQA